MDKVSVPLITKSTAELISAELFFVTAPLIVATCFQLLQIGCVEKEAGNASEALHQDGSHGVVIAATTPSWALFKCVVGGKTEYQERPCAGDAAQTHMREAARAAQPDSAEVPAALQAAINAGIVGSYPVRGMNASQLQSALGSASRVNASDYASGFQEQRIYERPNGTFYVYTENGIVRSSQFTEAIRPQAIESARSCPSAFDIRNAEVSANSIALNEAQRKEKMAVVQRMRECR